MKYIVKVPFIDKYSNEIYKEGAVLDISKKRALEILSVKDFIECIEPEKENPKKEKEK